MYVTRDTMNEIENVILILRNNCSGWDNIKPQFVKEEVIFELTRVCLVVILSVGKGYVPYELKPANIVLIYRNEDSNPMGNYRHISFLSKIFERLMYDTSNEYVSKRSILSPYQFGWPFLYRFKK